MKRLLLIPILALLSGCMTTTILADDVDCTRYIPSDWEEGVDHTPAPKFDPVPQEEIPDGFAPLQWLQSWTNFGLGEANQVDDANGRLEDSLHIIRECQENNRRAIERAKPKFLGIF